ncbi:helix-turn-helix transcriptional regulator [Heyndrickxia acidicola]|uniref:Helix-turn-helix transcriptional regulator n=1 Tax=Heyndrickxia acidicola TaxID=209389 RepID=A0ABU6MGY0_9BACI|nr:helix-turn-helix transcriptional regulator [Heyndrickxia acidicola]MED1203750.1 helix-turn-helix transcriptional regulator [Heyndrickxia acidicola]
MQKELSYTIEEIAQLLKVSKLTIYDLVKKGELPVFRVGRQIRVGADDLDQYIQLQKTAPSQKIKAPAHVETTVPEFPSESIIISGQDIVLDLLGKHIEEISGLKTLRSYAGSLNSLLSMYQGKGDIVSLHLYDGDTGEYNLPYVKKILGSFPYIVINLLSRKAGFYVQKGNPKQLTDWKDLKQKQITLVNREIGSGARILLDEKLRIHQIPAKSIHGYSRIESSHISVASAVATGTADVGVGIEKAAKMVEVDFIPLTIERYDLVILKTPENARLIQAVKESLASAALQSEIHSLGDYDVSQMGKVLYETL